jgi:hypothetical protein
MSAQRSDVGARGTLGRGRLAAVALALAALLSGAWLLAGPEGAAEAARRSAAAKIVGEVTALGGRGRLMVTPARGGRATALSDGSPLRLGDTVDPRGDVRATIKLTIPRGVSTETELIYLRPSDGRRHDVKLRRTGPRSTVVTIDG